MMSPSKVTILIFLLVLYSCEKEGGVESYTDSIESNAYYSSEVIPEKYSQIHGIWELYKVSGGFSGQGYEPDFDHLEIKNFGIYGFVRNNNLFEYGKIVLDTFDSNNLENLQVKLIPVHLTDPNPYMTVPEKYIHLKSIDSLDLISPCCDMYNFHFKRIQ